MKTTRIIAAVLSVCMLGGAVGYDAPLFEGVYVTADAAKQKYENVSGTCGESLTWTLDLNTGVLTVEGTGEMTSTPWKKTYKDSIKEVVISEGVTAMADDSFSHCENLTDITFPASCENLGFDPLLNCSSLENVTILNPYAEIYSAYGYSYSDSNNYTNKSDNWAISNNAIDINPRDIDDEYGYNVITNDPVFSGTIYGYENSTAERFAYDYCTFSVLPPPLSGTCGDEMTWEYDEETHTLTIEGTGDMYTFYSSSRPMWYYYRDDIERVVLPDLEVITDYAFADFTNLTEITLPDGLKKIGLSAFENCTSLSSINIPDTVTIINMAAFWGCSSLKSIDLPEGLLLIGYRAFRDCTSLKEITIPESVDDVTETITYEGMPMPLVLRKSGIDGLAFEGCTNLEKVVLLNKNTFIADAEETFGVSNYTKIYGYTGSTAEKYAEKYNYSFVDLDSASTKGDLNGDTMIDGRDATLVLAMYADSSSSGYVPTDAERAVGDVNNDTFIDGRDATIILGYYADLSAGASISFENYLKSMNYV